MISEILRAYPFIQQILNEYFAQGISPSTALIQRAYYRSDYNSDSKFQRKIIYGCIEQGRENAIDILVKDYFDKEGEGGFISDLAYLQFYEPEKKDAEMQTQDYQTFMEILRGGGFGPEEQEIMKDLKDYPEIAILWKEKIKEIARKGHNFVISTGRGIKSTWIRASFWLWNIRERGQYLQTLKRLKRQLERGVRTKMLLPTGVPLAKALGYTTTVKAALVDGMAWNCPKCGVRNIAESDTCVICNTPRSKP